MEAKRERFIFNEEREKAPALLQCLLCSELGLRSLKSLHASDARFPPPHVFMFAFNTAAKRRSGCPGLQPSRLGGGRWKEQFLLGLT